MFNYWFTFSTDYSIFGTVFYLQYFAENNVKYFWSLKILRFIGSLVLPSWIGWFYRTTEYLCFNLNIKCKQRNWKESFIRVRLKIKQILVRKVWALWIYFSWMVSLSTYNKIVQIHWTRMFPKIRYISTAKNVLETWPKCYAAAKKNLTVLQR